MNFTIPTSYKVGGQSISVKEIVKFEDINAAGECCVTEGFVRIALNCCGKVVSESSKQNTFFHELVHSILETMGEEELNSNEKFVNTFSSFLCESILSME